MVAELFVICQKTAEVKVGKQKNQRSKDSWQHRSEGLMTCFLVGGFNPIISPSRDENKKCLTPPPSFVVAHFPQKTKRSEADVRRVFVARNPGPTFVCRITRISGINRKRHPSFEAVQTHKNNMIKGIPSDLLTYICTQVYTYSCIYILHLFICICYCKCTGYFFNLWYSLLHIQLI